MTLQKITKNEIAKVHVQAVAGTRLKGTVPENKKVFDNFPQLVADCFNNIIDELTGEQGAANINTAGGKLQDVLDQYLANINDRYTKAATDQLVKENTDSLVQSVGVDLQTGVITITKKDGTTETVDTAIEKVPSKFELQEDDSTGKAILVVTNEDGSTSQTDVSNLLNHYTFENTDLIQFTPVKQADGYHITAIIPDASITLAQLNAEVTAFVNEGKEAVAKSETNAATSEANAKTSETNAGNSAADSRSWAVGGTGTRDGEDTDNSKYYSGLSADHASAAAMSETNATSQANKAEEQATSAASSATSAESSAKAAAASQTAAATSEGNAANSAQAAAKSEANAANSAQGIADAQAAAEASAQAAATSETNAAASAKSLSDAEASAKASASAAATSESNAAESAQAAKEAEQYVKDTSDIGSAIENHNTDSKAHADIRQAVTNLQTAVNNFLDSDDTTMDQLSELITAIKNNAGTIEQLTNGKVNTSDVGEWTDDELSTIVDNGWADATA